MLEIDDGTQYRQFELLPGVSGNIAGNTSVDGSVCFLCERDLQLAPGQEQPDSITQRDGVTTLQPRDVWEWNALYGAAEGDDPALDNSGLKVKVGVVYGRWH